MSPWRLLRQDLRAVLASLRLKLQELWRLNAAGELPRPGFWPRRRAAWFLPLLLGVLLALALVVIGLGLVFSTSRPEPSSQAPPSPVIQPMPEVSFPASTSSGTAKPRGTSPQASRFPESGPSGPNDASAPRPSTPDPAPSVGTLKVPAGGREPMATATGLPERMAAWPAAPPEPDLEAPLGAAFGDPPPGAGNPAAIAPTASPEGLEATGWLADPAGTLLEQLRDATPQAPPQALQLADSSTTVVLRTAAGFEQASTASRQDWADRWLELVREQGYSQLTLLDPAGRLLGNQARVGSGMILLQPFREPP